MLFFCFVIGWQRCVTTRWCPICRRRPSGAPPTCPAVTRQASPNSTGETVRNRLCCCELKTGGCCVYCGFYSITIVWLFFADCKMCCKEKVLFSLVVHFIMSTMALRGSGICFCRCLYLAFYCFHQTNNCRPHVWLYSQGPPVVVVNHNFWKTFFLLTSLSRVDGWGWSCSFNLPPDKPVGSDAPITDIIWITHKSSIYRPPKWIIFTIPWTFHVISVSKGYISF